jgi:UDP-2,4-diacetamido-2,4,6-trideoxy-beta-L-altropyranose hydrolase
MHLYVRADADGKIGTGHIMRCIALAQAWKDQGGEVTFISQCESGALKERIQNEGFRLVALDHVCPDSADLKNTLAILKSESADQKHWLVLDGHHFTTEYQNAIRDEGIRLLVIDDMNHLPHYHANILHNQNIHAPDLKYRCDEDTTLLLGTRYVLLRSEFLKYQDFKRQIPDRAKNILVTLGGADPDNVTLKVVEALKLLHAPDIAVRIIIGPANPHQKTLRKAIGLAHFKTEFLINPPNMPELMAWADLAISAGGSTCWELAFMGVPIMALMLADNQKAATEKISKEGFAVSLGCYKTFDEKITSGEINTLIQSKDRRLNMGQKGQALIRATGRNHLCERMFASSISIKPAKESDCELIWYWVNDQDVRNSAFCSDVIPFEDHKKWFHSKINEPQSYQFVGYDSSNQPIGQIRFDELSEREYDVDISIDKRFRERGYGLELIKQAIRELLNFTNVDIIQSYVKLNNSASKDVFLKAGFIREKDTIINNFECFHLIWKR